MTTIIRILKNNRGFLLFLFLLFLFRGSVMDWHPVPTGSMKPTILEGDVIVENKLAYDLQIPFTGISLARLGEPKRGDVIVFSSGKSNKRLVKRLVGLPGDTIEVLDDQIIVNGQLAHYEVLPESDSRIPATAPDREPGTYVMESTEDMAPHITLINQRLYNEYSDMGPLTIPEDSYFFLGDNRDNSADSRSYGVAPRSELRGRVFSILVSSRFLESWTQFRWERFFTGLD